MWILNIQWFSGRKLLFMKGSVSSDRKVRQSMSNNETMKVGYISNVKNFLKETDRAAFIIFLFMNLPCKILPNEPYRTYFSAKVLKYYMFSKGKLLIWSPLFQGVLRLLVYRWNWQYQQLFRIVVYCAMCREKANKFLKLYKLKRWQQVVSSADPTQLKEQVAWNGELHIPGMQLLTGKSSRN